MNDAPGPQERQGGTRKDSRVTASLFPLLHNILPAWACCRAGGGDAT